MNFLKPQLHVLFSDNFTTGYSIGEFPLVYYTVAVLWKIFGYHEFIFRLFVFILFITANTCLYSIFREFLKNSLYAFLLALTLFTSPIIVFYSINFLTNVPAISLVIIGWYFVYKFYKNQEDKYLLTAILFFLTGGLLKISSNTTVVSLFLIYLIETFNIRKFGKEGKLFNKPLKHLLYFSIIPIGVIIWYIYAYKFNSAHGGKFTFNSIWPIWDADKDERIYIMNSFFSVNVRQVFPVFTIVLSLLILIFITIKQKVTNSFFSILTLSSFLGCVFFIFLFYRAVGNHDYYLIDMPFVIILIYFSFFMFLKKKYPKFYQSRILKVLLILFFSYNLLNEFSNIHLRYWDKIGANEDIALITTSKKEIGYWRWMTVHKDNEGYEDIQHYIRKIGIKPEDKVISVHDRGFTITLYFMNLKGWNNFIADIRNPEIFEKYIQNGAKYIVVNDSKYLEIEHFKKYCNNLIGKYKGISFYKIN